MRAHAASIIALVATALVATALAPQLAGAQATPAPDRVQYGVTQSADTVTVGDPFRIVVRVRAPLGTVIEFPAGPDTTGAVQLLDPPAPATQQDPQAVDQAATYRVAAWDVGTLPIAIGELIVRGPGGEQRITLPAESVHVRSVLPADSTERAPRPVRPVFGEAGIPWWVWALVALAIALALYALWRWYRRRRRPVAVAPEDAYARAQAEFERVDQLGLVEVGERGRHVALVVEVLRDYLQARYPDARLSHTSTELLLAMRGRDTIPSERLGALLAESDLVKFARRTVSTERARQLGLEARAIVEAVEQAVQRAEAAEATEAAERQQRAAAAGKAA
ncbi:MAG: hypothetical protein H0X64_02025 [Gemmatimonadaceae bacterium]|nr:hypothetical protein [Gemmatimonadaceae bacterium]